MNNAALHPANIAVFIAYLAGMTWMGVWFARRNRTSDDYFRGGGKLPWWAVSLSIYATMFSSITFLSIPAMVYHTDMRYLPLSVGILLLAPVVVKWYLPFFRRLNLTSAYEYLEVRFNLTCRLFASAAFILFMVARTAVVTYLPAVALSAVVGIDVNWAIVAVVAVTIFYCTLGGVEAVVWSDFVQSVILIGGTIVMFAFLICGTDGGFSGFVSKGLEAGKFRVFDFAFDWSQPCFWVVLVGGIVANLASYTSDQCVVQRYMTTRDERGAAKSILFNGALSFVNNIVFFLLGVAFYTFIASHPGFLPETVKGDAVFPYFIGFGLPPGVSGLLLAAVAAATMSTLSANLNAAASAFTTDFYRRLSKKATDASLLRCGKVCTVAVGLFGGGFALVLANMDIQSIYDQFQRFLGILTGGLGCLFFMGIFLKRVNAAGATAGLVANYVVCFALDGLPIPGKPHLLLFGALGMATCLVVAPVVSAVSERRKRRAGASRQAALAIVLLAACGASAAPEAWLEFMGGNVRTDGLRCDLEAIKGAGFSGVQFFHINHGVKGAWPDCPVQIPCMSEKWDGVIRYLGDECARLGLSLTVQNCPGWSQSGGPWIDLDHCMRDIECARADLSGGEALRLPEVPARLRDADSDWRDVCVLAFPTPLGDDAEAPKPVRPVSVATNGDERVYTFAGPVTIRSMALPGLHRWNTAYGYHTPWRRVSLEAKTAEGWRDAVRTPLPVSSWRDYVYTFTLACDERTATVWRYRLEHDFPIRFWGEPQFFTAARQTDWEAKSARVLRSLLDGRPPAQDRRAWVDAAKIVDLTGVSGWKAPPGRWTVLRFGHVNSKRVNSPAPKEATGWECDKLDPKGIEANFKGYIGRLLEGPLKGRMQGMLVDSWECFGQTWTARMEEYFRNACGYELRKHLPSLFGYVIGSPEATERFLTDWRRTNGDLITKNYFGRMAELVHEAGLAAYYETAFGDIVFGDLLEYWKYADAPMCEFWYPHATKDKGGVGSYAFKSIRPCASAAHVYGKRRVVAEAFTGGVGIRWDEDFRKLQDVANRYFARGVTHLAYQSYTHAPGPDATPPGGCMGGFNGTPFTRLQTWWRYMPEFNGYVTRCEEFLEAGLPAQDVLWYLGDAVDHKPDEDFPLPEGFRADYLNHDVLTNRLAVKHGLFAIPEGTTWKVLWAPDERCMLPATRKHLAKLAADGGKVVFGGKDKLAKALSAYAKDVATDPALGDEPSEDFMWIHRRVDGFDRYFVAAGTNGWRGRVTFRAKGEVSLFDPVSRERKAWKNGDVLEIPPSRSVFVEFGIGMAAKGPSESPRGKKPCAPLAGWTLSFPAGWGAPEKVELERPVSWTEILGFSREARAFSGTVAYETEFECPSESSRFVLDLGRVESIADVFVNGMQVRTLWCEPYRCRLDGFVRKGRNRLRIEVTNTWRNRVIYDLGQPVKDRKTWMLYDRRFSPSPSDPFVPSGILGPVRLECDTPRPEADLADRIAARYKIVGRDVWYGYRRTTFDFEGHKAWIVEPDGEWRADRPWTWTMQWAEAYVERTGVLDLLAKGWRHVTVDTFRHRMDKEGLRVSRAFQKYLVEELGFAPKAKLVGMSWGGFFSVRYATAFPECVAKIYLDAPLLTLGGGFGVAKGAPSGAAAEIGPWAAMPPADGDWLADPRMPVNMAGAVAKAGIPIFLLYGGQDQTVRPEINCEPFAERFKAAGGKIAVRRRFAYGHHPHGEEHGRTNRIADFLD